MVNPLDIDALGLPIRVRNVFRNEGINTLADLLMISSEEFMRMPNFGKASLKQVEDVLAERGWTLKDEKSRQQRSTKVW